MVGCMVACRWLCLSRSRVGGERNLRTKGKTEPMVLWLAISFSVGVLVGSAVVLFLRRGRFGDSSVVDERIIEISQLSGGLAHEIRNPLSTLLLNLQLLDEDLGEGWMMALTRCVAHDSKSA